MEVKFLDSNMVNTSLLSLMQHYDEYYWAIAWATDNKILDTHLLEQAAAAIKLLANQTISCLRSQ